MIKDRNELLKKLIKLQYTRDDLSLKEEHLEQEEM